MTVRTVSENFASAFSFAKINWTLDVRARREDGYHEIESVMQRIKLADWMTFTREGTGVKLTITGPEADGVPTDDQNIVARAAALLGVSGVSIAIEKNIPNQAGLGGGSSNGATTLMALNSLFQLGYDIKNLVAVAAKLGSDVPFFLHNSSAIVSGLGEQVHPIEIEGPVVLILVKPEGGVSTKAAYDALDRLPGRVSYGATMRWPGGGPANDFEDIIYSLHPEVAQAREALKEAGAAETLLCGSGSTVIGWNGDLPRIAEQMRTAGYSKLWLTQTI